MYRHTAVLRQARIQAGLTQTQVAKASGFTTAHVNRFENGARQSYFLFVYYVTNILNDIQKQSLIDCLIYELCCKEDMNMYEMSVWSTINLIRESIKHEN